MREAVIVEAVRSPFGRRNGSLKDVHPVDLSADVLNALVARTGVDPALIDDVIWGCVTQLGDQSSNIGRFAVLAAGWPEHVPGVTINRACGSSQQALEFAVDGRDGRSVRPGGRRGRRGDDSSPARRRTGVRLSVRAPGDGPLRRLLVQPGHQRREGRGEVGTEPPRPRRVLGAVAREGGGRHRRRIRSPGRSCPSRPTTARSPSTSASAAAPRSRSSPG